MLLITVHNWDAQYDLEPVQSLHRLRRGIISACLEFKEQLGIEDKDNVAIIFANDASRPQHGEFDPEGPIVVLVELLESKTGLTQKDKLKLSNTLWFTCKQGTKTRRKIWVRTRMLNPITDAVVTDDLRTAF